MPFKPGQSGNPNGRPKKGQTFTDLLKEYLAQETKEPGKTRYDKLIEKMYEFAMQPDATMMKYLVDRVDGKPAESVQLSSDADEPMEITIVVKDAKTTNGTEAE